MKKYDYDEFIKKIEIESKYKKYVSKDIIDLIIDNFTSKYKKINYPKTISNPLEIVLQFYQNYNEEFYNLILNGINNNKIIINDSESKSFINIKDNITHINLFGNDSDLFILVHELAHYIDRNYKNYIIPDKYWFLSETFAFYMEKTFEKSLNKEKYKKLINARKNNRLYHETNMVKAIKYEYYYEQLFINNNFINTEDIDIYKIKYISQYKESNYINYLLQYPLANIISDEFINK